MAKQVHFDKVCMDSMMVGLNKVADAVAGTMGPNGRNVFIDDAITPRITNDGVTIANKIILEDALENAGGYVIRNVSAQQNDDVGDGTTTVSVLTQAIIQECLKRPENPMVIKESLKAAGEKVLKRLSKISTKIEKKDIERVALISAENKELADLITEIVNKLGEKAVINVEDSKTFSTEYEIMDGYEAHVGFMNPAFVTDNKSGRAIYEDIPILVTEKKISNLADIKPIFEAFQKENINKCVIVCGDIDDSMLGIFVNSKRIGTFNAIVIRASAWLLKDIEGAVGAKAISDSNGINFQNFTLEHLGFAKKVVCDANKTLFTTDGISAKQYARILENQAENDPNQFSAKRTRDRVAKLRGGVAVLKVGAPTDFEREYLKLKAEDAVKAVQAALAEGIVEGGGMALWRIAQEITPKNIGDEILKKAMTSPLRKIIENSGKDYTEIVKNLPEGFGYNAKRDSYENMIESGIIDPVKVERLALENAVSCASTFISTFALITDVPESKKQ